MMSSVEQNTVLVVKQTEKNLVQISRELELNGNMGILEKVKAGG